MLVLVLPIILNYIAYFISISQIEKEITQMNLSFYESAQRNIDTVLLSYRKAAINFRATDAIGKALDPRLQEAFMELKNTYLLLDLELKDCYRSCIYYKNDGLAVTASNVTEAETYFREKYGMTSLSYEDWKAWLDVPYSDDYLIIRGKETEGPPAKQYVALKYTLNSDYLGTYFVVLLDDSFFAGRTESAPYAADSQFEILTENNEVIVSSTGRRFVEEQITAPLGNGKGAVKLKLDGTESILTYVVSPVNKWKYVYCTPKKVYLRSINAITYMQLSILFAGLLLGIAVIGMMVRRMYMPIRKLLNMLPDYSDGYGNYDEYSRIESVLRENANARRQAKNAVAKQKEIVGNSYLVKLVKGIARDAGPDTLAELGIRFSHPEFLLTSFYLPDYNLLFLEEKDISDEKRYALMRSILINIFGELVDEKGCEARFLEVDAMLVCLINLPEEKGIDDLTKVISDTKEYIEKYFYVSFGAALSNPFDSIGSLAAAYSESISAMEYLVMMEETDIVCFKDLTRNKTALPTVSDYELNDICSSVRNGTPAEAVAAINNMIEDKLGKEGFAPTTYRYLLYDVTANILKNFQQYVTDDSIIQTIYSRKITSTEEIAELIAHICGNIEKESKESNLSQGKRDRLIEKIKAYLEVNYVDCGMNMTKVADDFGYVPSYISKLFKDSEGIGMVEYLNRLRVEKAKELLDQTELLLQEISERVGFYNSAALIRVFKKYAGTTPGNYKKMKR